MQCPSCHARYLVPDAAIGNGRNVRCAKCGHVWFHTLKADATPVSDLDKMLQEINSRPQQPKPIPIGSNLPALTKRSPHSTTRMLSGVLAALAVLLALFVFMPSLFGIFPTEGLVMADLNFVKLPTSDEHNSIYQISGKIVNSGSIPIPSPIVRITVVDGYGSAIQSWDFPSGFEAMKPGTIVPFASKHLNVTSNRAARFVVEIGNSLELALRRKPTATNGS